MIHLETLNLRFNRITRKGFESLAASSFLPLLSSLKMEGNNTYTRRGIERLKLYNHFGENYEITLNDTDDEVGNSDRNSHWWCNHLCRTWIDTGCGGWVQAMENSNRFRCIDDIAIQEQNTQL